LGWRLIDKLSFAFLSLFGGLAELAKKSAFKAY
jgi:hypothetical protein